MSQEVKLKVRGVQMGEDDMPDDVEVVLVGQMYEEDTFLCLEYEEVVDENESGVVQVAKNVIKIRDDQVEVIKEGPTESHMVFVPEQTTYTFYATPIGDLEVAIFTKKIQRKQTPNGFHLILEYNLEMNQTFISKCCVDVVVEQ